MEHVQSEGGEYIVTPEHEIRRKANLHAFKSLTPYSAHQPQGAMPDFRAPRGRYWGTDGGNISKEGRKPSHCG